LQALFEELHGKLLSDPIPNVKINLLKLYIAIQDKIDPSVRVAFTTKAKKTLSSDPDSDVEYYLSLI